eukprot:CAMPEP_0184516988 /NCGR_PEP_ID=MMETSP0198_2-20121128/5321_1 /TAXON_ID=1112570 /ORGANISM="Thraustochytrium sp., Strain LLF1b" /LENGTH=346 /DNA_ID=CAMNT_0026907343 /DNA_START=327 /DNA_END=1367 /DNA_ORIENTATION=+
MSTGMKAVVYDRFGPPEEVIDVENHFPLAYIDKGSDCILVKVHAASLTHKDLKVVQGDFKSVHSKMHFPSVLGGDVSGVVEAVGDRCRKFRVGDEVIGIVASGAIAEYVSAPESQFVRKPKKISHLHAAAFPCSGVLAFQCLHAQGKLERGQKVLILNASGGVGSLAVQMAHYKGAKVYATANKHIELVETLGADVVLDYAKCQWWQQLKGENIDLILDLGVGYSAWIHSKHVMSDRGRFISLVPDNPDGPVEYFNYKFGMRLRSFHSGGRYKYIDSIDLTKNGYLKYIAKLVDGGFIKPVLDPDSPFEFSGKAIRILLAKLGEKHTRGKLIVNIATNNGYAGPVE